MQQAENHLIAGGSAGLLSPPEWDGPAVLLPRQPAKLVRGAKDKEHAMSQIPNTAIAVIGIDIGKNSFHVVGIGPIISSAMVAAIGTGDVFSKGRDFGAWLGLVPKQISTGDRTILDKIWEGPLTRQS